LLDLVAPENGKLMLSDARIIAGDHDPVIMAGDVEVDLSAPERITYRFTGRPDDRTYAVLAYMRVRKVRYDAREMFRILGVDGHGREWNLGWTKPTLFDERDDVWTVAGRCEGIISGDRSGEPGASRAEVMFLAPPELQLGRLMTERSPTSSGTLELVHAMSVDGATIRFRYQPATDRLFVSASATPSLNHPFLAETIGEPLRILFGQLLYPRLVARIFQDGSSQIHIRRTHDFIPDAAFVALWPFFEEQQDRSKFWDLFAQLFSIAAREGPKQKIGFAAHTITRLYEEVIQAAEGTRWVWALTLASACEALGRRLKHIVPPPEPEMLREIDEVAAYLALGPGGERIQATLKGALKRLTERTAAKTLRELTVKQKISDDEFGAWTDIRNQVMHGSLVLPWSDEQEDRKIMSLVSLFHKLTREVAAVVGSPLATP
jgi:hypothetical protein